MSDNTAVGKQGMGELIRIRPYMQLCLVKLYQIW